MVEGAHRIGVGVGAVVLRGDHVLIIKRGKPPFLGCWSIPGGSLEFGERLEDGARRELREETGVEARILGLIDIFESHAGENGESQHILLIDYAAEWISGEPVAGDDAAAAEFVPFEEAVRRMSWDRTREAITRALALRDGAQNRLHSAAKDRA